MPEPSTLLVIGVHREELAFGERVAAGLGDLPITVYRIPEGISGRHPRQDQLFRYRLYHEELYLQLRQQLKAGTRLLIDLHAGQDSSGPAADLFCRDRALLDCVRRAGANAADGNPTARVRTIPLVHGGADVAPDHAQPGTTAPVAHTLIPPQIWRRQPPLYVAIECYLREPGAGEPNDWALARELIRRLLTCDRGDGRAATHDPDAMSSDGR